MNTFDSSEYPFSEELDQEEEPFHSPAPIWASHLTNPLDEEPMVTQKGREWIECSRVITLALLSSLMLLFVLILLPPILKFMVRVSRCLWNLI